MLNIKYLYILIGVLVILILGQTVKIERLKSDITELEAKIVVADTNTYQCKSSLKDQNDHIAKLSLDYELANAEYHKLLNQPPEVRFKTIYKEIPSIGVKSDECQDIKNLLDDIRNAGY